MDLLENLYNIENFGIYLFIVIGLLIVLFLVILFFGKKDEKKRKLEKTQTVTTESSKEEVMEPVNSVNESPELVSEQVATSINTETPKEEVMASPSLEPVEPATQMPFKEIEEPVQPVEVPTPVLEKPVVPDLASVALSQIEEEQKENVPVETEKVEKVDEPKADKEFDFDALADAINKELASIEKTETPTPTPVLSKEEETPLQYSVVEPEPQIPAVEAPKPEKKVMPTVFSSVYVNREKEAPVAPVKEEIVEPVVPKIELPKTIDLPKRNNE